MGGICSRLSCGLSGHDSEEEDRKFVGVQVAQPANKDVSQNGNGDSVTRNTDKQKDGHKLSISERVLGSKRMQKIKSIVGGTQGAQKAAGWPSWLTSVASEAIQGWVPRSVDSYEMLDKVSIYFLLVILSCS